jgi:hypothetical protein
MRAFLTVKALGQWPPQIIIKTNADVSKLTPSDGRVSARGFVSRSIHGRCEIRLAKTCAELTASPYICAGRLGYYGGTYENVFL